MNYPEKLKRLEKIFSSNPEVRRTAMDEDYPRPLFEDVEEFGRAIDDLMAARKSETRREQSDQRISLS